jgi:hypothetical protein
VPPPKKRTGLVSTQTFVELAEQCWKLHKARVPARKIASLVGRSKSHVQNLIRLWSKLPDADKAALARGELSAAEALRRVGPGKAEPARPRLTLGRVRKLLREYKSLPRSDVQRDGAIAALTRLIGD